MSETQHAILAQKFKMKIKADIELYTRFGASDMIRMSDILEF